MGRYNVIHKQLCFGYLKYTSEKADLTWDITIVLLHLMVPCTAVCDYKQTSEAYFTHGLLHMFLNTKLTSALNLLYDE